MKCHVYKSLRRAETYVFLREAEAFNLLPEDLRERLGKLEHVLELELTPDRKLARADAQAVRAELESRGFHLQLPPPPAGGPLDV